MQEGNAAVNVTGYWTGDTVQPNNATYQWWQYPYYPYYWQQAQPQCPNCGYCPHCQRSDKDGEKKGKK